ncbi:MAG TPA: 50S ribosomal protein L19e [Archaeoglobaceae archaeon]|nr:50S ribosomal protein L19e [Archaeoglobaceae archaeon]
MNLRFQKKMAAQILKCGENRVWIDPDAAEDVASAATKEDVRNLIGESIKRKPVKGISRSRINKKRIQKSKGRRKGHGSRKGKKGARMPSKRLWIIRIRTLRRRLKYLRDAELIDRRTYRTLYRKAKGGEFRSVAHLNAYLESQKILT